MNELLVVCDVLVLQVLRQLGRYVVRADRARFAMLDGTPFHLAHVCWRPSDSVVDKALSGAWEVVPVLLTRYGPKGLGPVELTACLDAYVHDLAITGTAHTPGELAYRLAALSQLESVHG